MKRLMLCVVFAGFLNGGVDAQTWPDYHLTNGTHYTSYGVEDYDPLYPKNLYIDPVAILQAGSTELDDICDANQVYLNGGTVYATAEGKRIGAVGLPDPYRGETVKAFVVPRDGETLTEQEVVAYCKERLAAYKMPKQIEFVEDLPKSAIGKVLRRELRTMEEKKTSTQET